MTSSDSAGTVQGVVLIRDAERRAGQRLPPSLILRCEFGQAVAFVDWRTNQGTDSVDVVTAFDDAPATADVWLAASDSSAAGLWSDSLATPLVRAMLDHDRFQVTAGGETLTFPLDSLREASVAFRELCDLDVSAG